MVSSVGFVRASNSQIQFDARAGVAARRAWPNVGAFYARVGELNGRRCLDNYTRQTTKAGAS